MTQFRALLLIGSTWLISIVFVGLTFSTGTFECISRRQLFTVDSPVDYSNVQQIADYANVAAKHDIVAIIPESNYTFELTYRDCYVITFSPSFPHGKKLYALFVIVVGIVPVVSSLIVALYIESMIRTHQKNMSEGINNTSN